MGITHLDLGRVLVERKSLININRRSRSGNVGLFLDFSVFALKSSTDLISCSLCRQAVPCLLWSWSKRMRLIPGIELISAPGRKVLKEIEFK